MGRGFKRAAAASQVTTVAPSLGASPYQIAVSSLNPNFVYYAAYYLVRIDPADTEMLISSEVMPCKPPRKPSHKHTQVKPGASL